jgi:putative tricarboxylic transport membrane protein
MKLPRRDFLHLAAGAAALPALSRFAFAQAYPSRPVTMIVPFAPGGGTDVAARIVGEQMARTLGQQIVIQNIAGAGGTTGSTRAMRADADGYTILMGQMGTHATSVALYPALAYKPEVDFEPIGIVSEVPQLIVARKDFAPNDLREFVAFVKTNSDKVNVGHAGVGSIFFSTCLMLNSILDVRPTQVPFNGGAPAMNALVGGQIDTCVPMS